MHIHRWPSLEEPNRPDSVRWYEFLGDGGGPMLFIRVLEGEPSQRERMGRVRLGTHGVHRIRLSGKSRKAPYRAGAQIDHHLSVDLLAAIRGA